MLNYKFTDELNIKKEQETVKGMTVKEMFSIEKQENSESENQKENKVSMESKQKESIELKQGENISEIPINERKLTHFTLVNGLKIEAYVISESPNYFYVSTEIEPNSSRSRIAKSMIIFTDFQKK